jgi:adenylyl-sulfate kinase
MHDRGFVLWLTGLSGAGKTTIANGVGAVLSRHRKTEILDGDEVRRYLSAGAGFSKEERDANVRRIGFVAALLGRNGVAAIVAAISPYEAARAEVRGLTEADRTPFVEVHVTATIDALVSRDPKGLYHRALSGDLPNFTGISDQYEPPAYPDLEVHTDREEAHESLGRVLALLRERALLPPP